MSHHHRASMISSATSSATFPTFYQRERTSNAVVSDRIPLGSSLEEDYSAKKLTYPISYERHSSAPGLDNSDKRTVTDERRCARNVMYPMDDEMEVKLKRAPSPNWHPGESLKSMPHKSSSGAGPPSRAHKAPPTPGPGIDSTPLMKPSAVSRMAALDRADTGAAPSPPQSVKAEETHRHHTADSRVRTEMHGATTVLSARSSDAVGASPPAKGLSTWKEEQQYPYPTMKAPSGAVVPLEAHPMSSQPKSKSSGRGSVSGWSEPAPLQAHVPPRGHSPRPRAEVVRTRSPSTTTLGGQESTSAQWPAPYPPIPVPLRSDAAVRRRSRHVAAQHDKENSKAMIELHTPPPAPVIQATRTRRMSSISSYQDELRASQEAQVETQRTILQDLHRRRRLVEEELEELHQQMRKVETVLMQSEAELAKGRLKA